MLSSGLTLRPAFTRLRASVRLILDSASGVMVCVRSQRVLDVGGMGTFGERLFADFQSQLSTLPNFCLDRYAFRTTLFESVSDLHHIAFLNCACTDISHMASELGLFVD